MAIWNEFDHDLVLIGDTYMGETKWLFYFCALYLEFVGFFWTIVHFRELDTWMKYDENIHEISLIKNFPILIFLPNEEIHTFS